jgi:hypothetical protein
MASTTAQSSASVEERGFPVTIGSSFTGDVLMAIAISPWVGAGFAAMARRATT